MNEKDEFSIDEPSFYEKDDNNDNGDDYEYYKKLGDQFINEIKNTNKLETKGGVNLSLNKLKASSNSNNNEHAIKTNKYNEYDKEKDKDKNFKVNVSKEKILKTNIAVTNKIQPITLESKNKKIEKALKNGNQNPLNSIKTPIKINNPMTLEKLNSYEINSHNTLMNNKLNNSILSKSKGKIDVENNNNKDVFSQMRNFDKKLKNEYIKQGQEVNKIEELEALESEDEIIKDDINTILEIEKTDLLKRYQILQKKYKESQNSLKATNLQLIEERNKQKDIIDMLEKKSEDFKDKKLIELVKKNTDLSLKIEKQKLKEKELESIIENQNNSKNINNNNQVDNNINPIQNSSVPINLNSNNNDEISNLRKSVKILEKRVSELVNKNQQSKQEINKLDSLLKRELGENYLENEKNWKGRAEVIESLKVKIKFLESIINNHKFSLNKNDKNNEISENKINDDEREIDLSERSIEKQNSGKNKHVSTKVINNITINKLTNNLVPFNQYKKEKDSFKADIIGLQSDKEKLLSENVKLKSRKEVLEKELKFQKESLTSKIKLLLEKSDNDEKLINAMNKELEKKTGKSITGQDVLFNLQQEILSLRDKLKAKTEEIEKLEKNFGGTRDLSLYGMLQKIEDLEKENYSLKKGNDDVKIYDALTRDNAKLRLQIAELKMKLEEK